MEKITNLSQIENHVRSNFKGTVSVGSAACPDVINSMEHARKAGIANGYLVGEKEKIEKIMRETGVSPSNYIIEDEPDPYKACIKALRAINEGRADVFMKGDVKSGPMMKAVLDKKNGIASADLLFHILACEIKQKNKIVMMSDGGIILEPTIEEKMKMIPEISKVASCLGIERPHIALISALNEVSCNQKASIEAARLSSYFSHDPNIQVTGPIDLTGAIFPEKNNKNTSTADAIIVPNIECGNLCGKTIMFLSDIRYAMIVMGAQVPIIMTSRTNPPEAKYLSIAFALYLKYMYRNFDRSHCSAAADWQQQTPNRGTARRAPTEKCAKKIKP